MFDRFKRLAASRAGNVSVAFALALAPLTASVGGAVDYTRTFTIGSEIQNALDTGVLAAASLSQTRPAEEVVRAYVEAAIAEHRGVIESLVVTVTPNVALNARTVAAEATVTVPTVLLGVAGIERLALSRGSEATEQVRNLEISLVLDVSGSMSGSKIEALREAAAEFVQVVMAGEVSDMTSISIIPYNGGVRLPDYVNAQLVSGGTSNAQRSGCPEYGDDHPIVLQPPANGLNWLEWRGRAQHGSRNSAFCPESNEASVFLRNNQANLLALIEDLDAGGNTGLDIATAWGARALDPVWRGRLGGNFADRPVDYDDPSTIKALVVMTDGAATAQIRNYWDEDDDRWRNYNMYSAAQARTNMAAACDGAEARGVDVYTIAFQLSGSTNRDLMRNCASRPENYYEVEDMDIAAAFSAIAADLNTLRLSR
ncbi:MAG: pilus assembly protein [Alphaproteobacteria bacterium]|nr:pilus assembly protein [Alphaproteobacteria bacterium]